MVPLLAVTPKPDDRHLVVEVMVAVKVKKESYHAWLTYGALETADGYQQAKWSAVLAVAEANIWVWIEFIEAMDQDFWRTLRQYCQNW